MWFEKITKHIALILVGFFTVGITVGAISAIYKAFTSTPQVVVYVYPTALVCSGPTYPLPSIIYSSKPITRYDNTYVITGPDNQLVYYEKLAMDRCVAMPAEMAKDIEKHLVLPNSSKDTSGIINTKE